MAAINTGKVVVGGLVAGLVLNVIDFVSNMWLLKNMFESAMNAVNPNLNAIMQQRNHIIEGVLLDFALGVIVVWVYAAIRPRFGPGPKTAAIASVAVWATQFVAYFSYHLIGMASWSFMAAAGGMALITVLIGGQVGAKLYSEA